MPGRGTRDSESLRGPSGHPSEFRLDFPVQQGIDRLGGGQAFEQHLADGTGDRHVDAQLGTLNNLTYSRIRMLF